MPQAALDDFNALLNSANLQPWVESQPDIPGSGPLTEIRQLQGGSQNNLFLMRRGAESFVLRRPPRHIRKGSNETMLREARVLKALGGSDVPHPTFYAVCADEAVIGACFYVMEPLDGFAPNSMTELPGAYRSDPSWRRAMGPELVRGAAALSALDHRAIGLEDFGKPDDWHARQVSRWRSQLEGYRELPGYGGSDLPHVDEVGEWLTRNLPDDRRIGIIHGDYQFANVMFAHDQPRIVGLIDWELSSLGDPMLDMGWVLTSWIEDGDPEGRRPSVNPWSDFMSRDELVRRYCDLTGRDRAAMDWYFTLACFKLGCILEGTYARSKSGNAPAETGERLHAVALWLLKKARQLIA